jgi:hypothetical protein
MTDNNPATRTDLRFGPFNGPNLKEHLEAGPVTFDNVVTAYRFQEVFEGMAPALTSARSATAGFKLRLPEYVLLKADSSATVPISLDRSGGYSGAVDVSVEIPKPPNLADENPFYALTSSGAALSAGTSAVTMVLTNGAAQRPGSQVAVIRARGDATVLNTLQIFTATRPQAYADAATGNNLSRLIPGDSPRNPQMSSVVQNAGGRAAVDGDANTGARFEAGTAPWIMLDVGRSYLLGKTVIEWDPAFRPQGELVLTLSEFPIMEAQRTLADVLALPADVVTRVRIPDNGSTRIEVPWPAGTVVRQAKLWVTQTQANETRLREVSLIAR